MLESLPVNVVFEIFRGDGEGDHGDYSTIPKMVKGSPTDSLWWQFLRRVRRISVQRRVQCHTTNTKRMLSLLDGNQFLLIVGRMPRSRIPRSAIPFPAISSLPCLLPSLGETLHLVADGQTRSRTKHGTLILSAISYAFELRKLAGPRCDSFSFTQM
jgi:hypothetical protein